MIQFNFILFYFILLYSLLFHSILLFCYSILFYSPLVPTNAASLNALKPEETRAQNQKHIKFHGNKEKQNTIIINSFYFTHNPPVTDSPQQAKPDLLTLLFRLLRLLHFLFLLFFFLVFSFLLVFLLCFPFLLLVFFVFLLRLVSSSLTG